MPLSTARLVLVSTLLLGAAGCYGDIFGDPGSAPTTTPAPNVAGPHDVVVDVDPERLAEWAELPAEELFEAVAAAFDVPADLLEATAWVTSALGEVDPAAEGLPAAFGWFALDAADLRRAMAITGLTEAQLSADRAGDVVAGAALLHEARVIEAPEAGPLAAAWWPAVASFPGLSTSALGDAFASEVFAVLQGGLIAPTSELDERDEPDVVVVAPRRIEDLPAAADVRSSGAPQYPLALGVVSAGAAMPRDPGPAAIETIDLRPTHGSWARSLDAVGSGAMGAHLVVRRSDGAVLQAATSEQAVPTVEGVDHGAVVVRLAAPSDGFAQWTPPLLEGSARAAAWLSLRHDIPLDSAHVRTAALGARFPAAAWLEAARCFTERRDCVVPSGAPEDVDVPSGARSTPRDGSVPSVPYFYQYANALHPSASCQNTSIAMVLKWLGWSGTPDTITARFGKDLAQSPEGLAQVFNTLASEAGLTARLTPRRDGTIEGMRALLAQGKPVIVHGYMTGYGHVVVARGFTGSQYLVNDPAGRWTQTWKGGFPYGWSASIGRGIRYSAAAFEQAVGTSNGYTSLPLWYHQLTDVDGGAPVSDPEPPAEEGSGSSTPPEPLGEEPAGAPGGSSTPPTDSGSGGPYPWASVQFLTPHDGDTVGNPLSVRAARVSGQRIEFWSGAERLAEPRTDNPADATVAVYTGGERTLTAKNISAYGTLLATHSVRVNVEQTASLTPLWTEHGDLVMEFRASTDVENVAYVTYEVDGYVLRDTWSGESRAPGPDFMLMYAFHEEGLDRLLVARAYDTDGTLLAEGRVVISITGSRPAAQCGVVGEIACGGSVSGDTSSTHGRSDVLNGYPSVVGNYHGPEVGYTWTGTGGEVEIGFVNPTPSLYDLDILILEQDEGTCSPADLVTRIFNSGTFESRAGASYTLVVDGFAGDQGAFTLEVNCD